MKFTHKNMREPTVEGVPGGPIGSLSHGRGYWVLVGKNLGTIGIPGHGQSENRTRKVLLPADFESA
ncbi:MAG: hypothetical protein Q6K90_07960, partial [Gloeomargarita sp. HHBFW_bins_162]